MIWYAGIQLDKCNTYHVNRKYRDAVAFYHNFLFLSHNTFDTIYLFASIVVSSSSNLAPIKNNLFDPQRAPTWLNVNNKVIHGVT